MTMSTVSAAAKIGIPTSNWNTFYSLWLEPLLFTAGIAILAVLVLLTISGLLTRFLAPAAEAWSRWMFWCPFVLGALCILTVAVFLPVYPIFRPFGPGRWLPFAYIGVAVLGAVLVGVASWPIRFARTRLGIRPVLSIPVGAVLSAIWIGLILWFYIPDRGQQLQIADFTIGVLGVVATAISLGQNRRLQIDARTADGKVDAAATDYLTSRLQTLGSRPPEALSFAQSTDLSQLVSQDLNAIPGGAAAAAIARVLYAVRPGLAWRAQITVVDPERLALQLSRNSRLVENAVISRPDLRLPRIATDAKGTEDQDRAKAQLLTAAAACVLMRLSDVHPELKIGLCGASQWKSVALHVIATEPALSCSPDVNMGLLSKATNADGGYALARLDYVMQRYLRTTPKTVAVRQQFATLLATQLDDIPRTSTGKPKQGYELMYLRILRTTTAMRANALVQELVELGQDRGAMAARFASELMDLRTQSTSLLNECGRLRRKSPDDQVREYAKSLRPIAKDLRNIAEFLLDGEPRGAVGRYRTPEITMHNAARAALMAEFGAASDAQFANVINRLTYAISTPEDYVKVMADPSFWLRRFRSAVVKDLRGFKPDMLTLPPFSSYAGKLRAAGITTFPQFAFRLATTTQETLATYLGIDPVVVAYLADLVGLANSRPQLTDADVLAVFVSTDITRADDLDRQVSDAKTRTELIQNLRAKAGEQGRASLPSIATLEDWLRPAPATTNTKAAMVLIFLGLSKLIRPRPRSSR